MFHRLAIEYARVPRVDEVVFDIIELLLQGVADLVLMIPQYLEVLAADFLNQREKRVARFDRNPERQDLHQQADGRFIRPAIIEWRTERDASAPRNPGKEG